MKPKVKAVATDVNGLKREATKMTYFNSTLETFPIIPIPSQDSPNNSAQAIRKASSSR